MFLNMNFNTSVKLVLMWTKGKRPGFSVGAYSFRDFAGIFLAGNLKD